MLSTSLTNANINISMHRTSQKKKDNLDINMFNELGRYFCIFF